MEDKIETWKRMTNTERRDVLDSLRLRAEKSLDGRAFDVAYGALQALIDTPAAHVAK